MDQVWFPVKQECEIGEEGQETSYLFSENFHTKVEITETTVIEESPTLIINPVRNELCDSNEKKNVQLADEANTARSKTAEMNDRLTSDPFQRNIGTARRADVYKCNMCDYSTTTSRYLLKHSRKHTGEKPYKCSMCYYATAHPHCLKMHLKKHTGEKPYKCTMCDYATAYPHSIQIHLRTHTKERPYKCTMCDYAATQQCALKVHQKQHTEEKPYKCDWCAFAASHLERLNNHIPICKYQKPYNQKYR